MVVKTMWPGATTLETMQQVTDRIEKKLEELPNVDYQKSYTKPGEFRSGVCVFEGSPLAPRMCPISGTRCEKRSATSNTHCRRACKGLFLQRRVWRYLCPDLRAYLGRLLFSARCGIMPSACELNCSAFPTSQRSTFWRPGLLNLSGVPDRANAAMGLDISELIQTLQAQNAIQPSGTVDIRNRREDRDPCLRSVHVRREPESHQFPFQRPVLSAERYCQSATRLC